MALLEDLYNNSMKEYGITIKIQRRTIIYKIQLNQTKLTNLARKNTFHYILARKQVIAPSYIKIALLGMHEERQKISN